jgi:Protein of unknown function (DUF664)
VSDLKEEPAGTNLLGLVKHLAGLEYGYLGESLGFPAPESMSWIEDGSIWRGADTTIVSAHGWSLRQSAVTPSAAFGSAEPAAP